MRFGEFGLDLLPLGCVRVRACVAGRIHCSDVCISGTFVVLFLQLRKTRSAAGFSLQTLATVVGARVIHLISHNIQLHYSPNVLPWFIYPTMDVFSACAGVALLLSFCLYYFPSYEKEKDNFGIHIFERLELVGKNSPLKNNPFLAASFLYASVAVIALLWYAVRKSQRSFLVSYFCCYYEAMGAVALIPQLWMFHQDKRVSPLLANFVVLTAMHRLFTLAFWIFYPRVFIWRYPDNRGVQIASETLKLGVAEVTGQVLVHLGPLVSPVDARNLLILSDFLFYWLRSKLRGDREVIIGDLV